MDEEDCRDHSQCAKWDFIYNMGSGECKVPLKTLVLMFNGTWLSSPQNFHSQEQLDAYINTNGTEKFLIIPDARKD